MIEKFLWRLRPLLEWIDHTFTWNMAVKKINGDDYYKWRDRIFAGCVFLTATKGLGSNIVNPSSINHGAIYFGRGLKTYITNLKNFYLDRNLAFAPYPYKDIVQRLNYVLDNYGLDDEICYVIESVHGGVKPTNLVTFLTTKDYVKIVQPKNMDKEQMMEASRTSVLSLGLPYDYGFSDRDDAKYCFEVCADAYKAIGMEIPTKKYTLFSKVIYEVYLSCSFEDEKIWQVILDSRVEHGK